MILLNKVEMTAEEVCEEFNVPYKKLLKSSEFRLRPADNAGKPGQSPELSVKAGVQPPATIMVKWKGKSMEIRYAETVNDKVVGDKIIPEYHPRKVKFEGELMIARDDQMDLAIFLFLHPYNFYSPFRDQFPTTTWMWEFKDYEKEGEMKMEKNNALLEAMQEINDFTGEPLKIIAKGLGLQNVDIMSDKQIQSNLVDIAMKDAVEFNKKIGSQNLQFRGLVIAGIDRGLFKEIEKGGRLRWVWAAGEQKGQDIVDIRDNGVVHSEILIEHVLQNVNIFYPILATAHKTVMAENNADDYFSQNPIDLKGMFNTGKTKLSSSPVVNLENEFGGGSDETSDVDQFVNEENVTFDPIKQNDDEEDFDPEELDQEVTIPNDGPRLHTDGLEETPFMKKLREDKEKKQLAESKKKVASAKK